ncbi:MAG: hypothetical protein WBC07_05160 [Methylotenera sp.]
MPLADLTEKERQVVFECLKCVAAGKVILHDWEFQTLFGITASAFKKIAKDVPKIDDSNIRVRMAINNAMNNLLGYPHGYHEKWAEVMPIPLAEIERVFTKWRNNIAWDAPN